MGEPVRIVDLVHNFANLLNVRDVTFRFTGLRPGEKLSEELFGDGEEILPTDHPRISMTRTPSAAPGFRANLRDLYDAASHNRPDEVFQHLHQLVPEYIPAPALVPALVAATPYPDDF
jgi:FlaA1/EpsC-like NDP-sugar epimerase